MDKAGITFIDFTHNGSHEGFKVAEYVIRCLECGKWYFKGKDISIYEPKERKD